MTKSVMDKRIPESQRNHQEVALDRAVSELFHEFGVVIPAKPQIGMTNVKPADPATFAQRMLAALATHAPDIHNIIQKFFEWKQKTTQQEKLQTSLENTNTEIAQLQLKQTKLENNDRINELKKKQEELTKDIGTLAAELEVLKTELLGTKVQRNYVLQTIESIEETIVKGHREAILPARTSLEQGKKAIGESYGREFMEILQAANSQN